MNELMLKLALAAIDFAVADQEIASRMIGNAKKDGMRHHKICVKYARRRLVSAQDQLTAACALLRENDDD